MNANEVWGNFPFFFFLLDAIVEHEPEDIMPLTIQLGGSTHAENKVSIPFHFFEISKDFHDNRRKR